MPNIIFEYLNKNDFPDVSYVIFNILADNMGKIAPTGNSREDDFNCWYAGVNDGLKQEERQVVIIKDSECIIGFFQYYTNDDTFMMEEIQLKPEYQGKSVFRNLYGFLLKNINSNIKFVEAYANKENLKSIGILEHLGLIRIGMNKNGNSFHFRGDYSDLINWYKTKMTFEERKNQVKSYLGKKVYIKIDRPMGYIHKKENYSLIYPINYGYIPGVLGGDGEELDVYLLGVDEAVEEFECEIIAIVHRHNDIEDKLVGAPVGKHFSKDEIVAAINFQEQYYDTEIEVI